MAPSSSFVSRYSSQSFCHTKHPPQQVSEYLEQEEGEEDEEEYEEKEEGNPKGGKEREKRGR